MSWFQRHNFNWQWYTPVTWPWIYYNRERTYYSDGINDHYDIVTVCIGPIQMRWYK